MEAELVAAALAMKEAVFGSNMMLELGFGSTFNTVPVYLDNKSAIRVASIADLGTKFLATPRFRELISKIQAFGDNAID